MRVGVLILPEHRWADAAEKWRRAEALGFDHAWTYDHLAWRDLRDSTWFSAIPTLTAAACVTTTLRLGTLVASPNFRHPVSFARELISLDDISGGRVTLGIGSGGLGWDATILGQAPWPLAERTQRFEEFIALLDTLLREREVTYEGRYWSANEARTHPGCVQQPRVPFAIAATAPRAMRICARYGDIWVTNGDRNHVGPPLAAAEGAALVMRQTGLLEAACAAEGRDPSTMRRLVLTGERLDSGLASQQLFEETKAAYDEVGVTDFVFHWPRPTSPYAGDESMIRR